MAIHTLNDQKIDVPDEMKIYRGGMFDTIIYRGFEICMFEEFVEKDGLYVGPFLASDAEGEIEGATLAEIKTEIDTHLGGAK